jgi:hypothetical protein
MMPENLGMTIGTLRNRESGEESVPTTMVIDCQVDGHAVILPFGVQFLALGFKPVGCMKILDDMGFVGMVISGMVEGKAVEYSEVVNFQQRMAFQALDGLGMQQLMAALLIQEYKK